MRSHETTLKGTGTLRRLHARLATSLRAQLLGHLVASITLAALLGLAMGPTASAPAREAEPFTTQTEVLAVTVVVRRTAPPAITAVQPLARGRLSVTRPGDHQLRVEDAAGRTLYELSFRAGFVMPGIPGEAFDAMRLTFVVPAGEDVARIVVTGPQGTATHALTTGGGYAEGVPRR